MTWSWIAARDRPAPEGLEQPRADQRVGDERVDDRHDGRADEAQEDRVDAQGGVRARAVEVDRQRGAGQQRDRVRDRVDRVSARRRRSKKIADPTARTTRMVGEPEQPLLRGARVGRGTRPIARVGGPPIGLVGRPWDVGLGRRRPPPVGDVDRGSGRRSCRSPVGCRRAGASRRCDRRAGARSGSRPGGSRRVGRASRREDPTGEAEPAAGLAVDRGGHEPGRGEGRGRQRHARPLNSSGMWAPSSWSNIRMTTRIAGLSSGAASAVLRLPRSSLAGQHDGRGRSRRRRRAACAAAR